MKAITGTVIGGRIELPKEFATEGAHVVVLTPGSGEPIRLSQADDRELWEAMEDLRRGDFVDGEALLIELRSLTS